jgi:hypothetical protein
MKIKSTKLQRILEGFVLIDQSNLMMMSILIRRKMEEHNLSNEK